MKINLIANLNGSLMGLSFGPESEVVVGREIGCSIAPMTADGLSRRHARLYVKDGAWHVEDLGSTNGTFRAGKKITAPEALSAKDKLQFGRFELTVDEFIPETGTTTPPAPAPVAEPVPPVTEIKPVAPIPPLEPVAELPPVEELKPVEPLAPAKPVTPAQAASAGAAAGLAKPNQTNVTRPTLPIKPGMRPVPAGIRKPTIGGGAMKPGLKLPPKPGLASGLKLPPKPGLASGLKLPPKKPAIAAPKPPAVPAKTVLEPVTPLEPITELTPLEPITPIE